MAKEMSMFSYPQPLLADDIVALRPWLETDLVCVEQASRDPYITSSTSVPKAYTETEGVEWIRRQWGRLQNGEGISFAIALATSDQAVGCAVLMFRPQPGAAGLGYWVIESARGQHLAARAVALLVHWALVDVGLARVEALVEPRNEPSQRVLERNGFQREGHLRSYLVFGEQRRDALIYSLIPSDLAPNRDING